MTKGEVKNIKALLNGKYTSYYSSKTESLSVRVYSYINNSFNPDEEKKEIDNFMELIKNSTFSTEVLHRTYQGFIHDTCIIVK